MKHTLDPQYRDDYMILLEEHVARGPLLASRVWTSEDGSRTDLYVYAADSSNVIPVTLHVAHALRQPLHRDKGMVRNWGVRMSSGGTNPVTELEAALRRVLGDHVVVREG